MAISVEEVTDREQLRAIEPEWSRLVAEVPAPELFSTPEWITSWLDAFWVGQPIRFLLARDAGRLVGLAPLLVDGEGMFCCRNALALPISAISWRGEILHADESADAVLDAFLTHLDDRGSFRLNLGRVAADSATAQSLRRIAKSRRLWTVWRGDHRTPLIRLPGTLDEYLESRSKHVRHELRRKRKKLEKAATVTVHVAQRADEMDAAFEHVRTVEANSWKGEAQTSFLEAPFAEQFYRDLFAKTVDRGWVRVYLMSVDGRPAAHLFGMVFRNRYYAFNASFDTALGTYSPGSVLMLHGIEDLCGEQLDLLDLMGSEYRWKNELATDLQDHVNVCIFPHFVCSCGPNWAVDQHAKPFARRHLPGLVRLKRTLVERRRNGGDKDS